MSCEVGDFACVDSQHFTMYEGMFVLFHNFKGFRMCVDLRYLNFPKCICLFSNVQKLLLLCKAAMIVQAHLILCQVVVS